jgi:nitrate/nitrite transporter NarK
MNVQVYLVDPASTAQYGLIIGVALSVTALACATAVAIMGRRAWWVVALVILIIPSVTTYPFGARQEWSLQYLPDVLLPMALVLGLPGALLGSAVGAAMRFWSSKKSR